jgi:molecular chaperone Hsp33
MGWASAAVHLHRPILPPYPQAPPDSTATAARMTDVPDEDVLHRFLLERSGVRGVLVQLDETWQAVRSRAAYPPTVLRLLGETLASAALFTGHAKVEGRLSIQMRGHGALRTLFAECTRAGTLRGLARWSGALPPELSPRQLGEDAVLAITIETGAPAGREPTRYQGLVGLDADSLGDAFESYFERSEQLPTRLLLSADDQRAVGIMLQQLPGSEGDADAWPRAQALFDTLGPDELRRTPAAELLYRLFHEEGVRLLASQPLEFGCSCSRERVGNMLLSLGREEAFAALRDDVAEVICEFCNQHYHFDRVDMEQLFAGGGSESGPTTPM